MRTAAHTGVCARRLTFLLQRANQHSQWIDQRPDCHFKVHRNLVPHPEQTEETARRLDTEFPNVDRASAAENHFTRGVTEYRSMDYNRAFGPGDS